MRNNAMRKNRMLLAGRNLTVRSEIRYETRFVSTQHHSSDQVLFIFSYNREDRRLPAIGHGRAGWGRRHPKTTYSTCHRERDRTRRAGLLCFTRPSHAVGT